MKFSILITIILSSFLCSCSFFDLENTPPEFNVRWKEMRIESTDLSSDIVQNLILGLNTSKDGNQSFYKLQFLRGHPTHHGFYYKLFDQAFNLVELCALDYISQGCIAKDSLRLKIELLQRDAIDSKVGFNLSNEEGLGSYKRLSGFEDVIEVSLPLDLFENYLRIAVFGTFPCAIAPDSKGIWCHNGWRRSIYSSIEWDDTTLHVPPYLWSYNHLSMEERKNCVTYTDGANYFYISKSDLSMFPKCETSN